MKYSLTETTMSGETFLYCDMEEPSERGHLDVIKKNQDRLRIISYVHLFPGGSERIHYGVHGYAPLDKVFRRRHINWQELSLLLYGVVHTLSNAKKCSLFEDSFVLDPKYVYLKHDSVQPFLLYLPASLSMSLQNEFLALLDFLDSVADPGISKNLIATLKNSAQENFDMATIINIVVQAVNENIVEAPSRPAVKKAETNESNGEIASKGESNAPKSIIGKKTALSAESLAKPTPISTDNIAKPAQPVPLPTATKGIHKEAKKGFFARFFGWGVKQKEPDDFLPTIDDRTMIDFTIYEEMEVRPTLYVMEGGFRTMQIPITSDNFVLGRNPSEVDFCFNGPKDMGISRVHAAIILEGNNYLIEDKGSSGGTFVNDKRVASGQSASLKNGDTIGLYTKKLLFEINT